MKKSIEEIQQELVEEFAMFEDRMDKYEYIIDQGKELDGIADELKVDDALIKGCQSRVWLHATPIDDDRIHFKADSDAFIVKGLVRMMLRVFDGQKKVDIMNAKLEFMDEIGLQDMLSPTRSNGLASLIKQIKLYSIALQAK